MAATEMPRITQDLVRLIARQIAGIELKDWKELGVEDRRRHLQTARHALDVERRHFRQRKAKKA